MSAPELFVGLSPLIPLAEELRKRGISVIASLVRQSMTESPDVKGAKKTKVTKGRKGWGAGYARVLWDVRIFSRP